VLEIQRFVLQQVAIVPESTWCCKSSAYFGNET